MDIILLRHAERIPGLISDPELSGHGLEQAESLAEILTLPKWGRPQKLYASPKKRTRQTLGPLSAKLGLPVETLPDLDEKAPGESVSDFRHRIQNLIEMVAGPTQVTPRDASTASIVWCTHLDWIEEFRSMIDCEEDLQRTPYDQWSPGQFLVLRPIDWWKVISFGRAP